MDKVLGVLSRADDPVDVELALTPVGVGQLAERVLVAVTRPREGLLGHACILSGGPFQRIEVMTPRGPEIRRSVFVASNASTEDSNERRSEMAKIVLSGPQNVSLDGVVQDPDGKEGFGLGGWFIEFGGKDLEEWNKVALDEALGAEAWLLGRRSYEFFGARWRPRSGALADRLNTMPKYVVSSTLEDPDWTNSTVLKGDVVTEVSKLKQELDGEVVVPASYQLARTLMDHDLVDELRLVVFPVVLGAGERFFGETSGKKPIRLLGARTIGEGLALLRYEAVRDTWRL